MKSSFLIRTKILLFFVISFSLVLLLKLFYVQVVYSSTYSDKADRQYVTPSDSIFERGKIFFTRKDGQLDFAALQITGFKLAINPSKIVDAEDLYNKLSSVVDIDYDDFIAKSKKTSDPYEEVATRLSEEEADAISLFKISEVQIVKEKWRFYPGENLAAHSLGFVAYKGDELAGRYGLEREYNKELTRSNDNPYMNFFAEVFSNINQTLFDREDREGDIVTTIEPAVQGFLEKKLEVVRELYQVDSIGGIIINPVSYTHLRAHETVLD